MTVIVKQGNMFLHQEYDFLDEQIPYKLIAHGCNMQGVMGAGFAKQVKDNLPWAYRGYKSYIDNYGKTLLLGQIIPVRNEEANTIVINCLTQRHTGPDASLTAITSCVKAIEVYLKTHNLGHVPVYMPFIGCGIGGLKWVDVEKIVADSTVEFRAYWV